VREYDLVTVCRWLGNSPKVAAKNHVTSVDLNADFRKATGVEVQEKDAAQKAARNPAQQAEESDCMDSHPCDETQYLQVNAKCCDLPPPEVGLNGVEPLTSSLSATRSNQLSYKPLAPFCRRRTRLPAYGPRTPSYEHSRPSQVCLSAAVGYSMASPFCVE
jgi:hypothetical protein